jgi:hypothetical protein
MTDNELAATTSGFAGLVLGLNLYEWQCRALLPLERATGPNGKRQNISVAAPNGSGKDSHIIPTAAYWWLALHPGGRVVVTSRSDLQITGQTIVGLDAHWRKFGYAPPIKSPHYELTTPEGGQIIAFVTNDPSRAEGWHSRPGSPLLMIVNEAKEVDEGIFDAIDGRCTPDALMFVSSPGLKVGRFYETHHKLRPQWHCISAGLADCPHIPKERIEHVLATYGEKHPVTRSTLYGEFMEADSEDPYVLTREQVLRCIANPPSHLPGFKYGFFDFADGRAENVLVLRNGNKYEIADAWREEDKDAVVGRALYLLGKHGMRPENVGADAAAKDILDAMAGAGWPIQRQNFGVKLQKHQQYKSWSVFAWLTGAKKIIDRDVIIPDDPTLIAQLVNRKKAFTVDGRLALEEKYQMQKRNIESPDRADALFGCMAAYDISLMQPRPSFWDVMEQEDRNTAFGGISVGL